VRWDCPGELWEEEEKLLGHHGKYIKVCVDVELNYISPWMLSKIRGFIISM
jgi:hypothetical protein